MAIKTESVTDLAKHLLESLTEQANEEMPSGLPAFSLRGVSIASSEMADPSGLLPALVWHADRLAKYAMDRSFGLDPDFIADENSLLGHSVSLEKFSGVSGEALLFLMESFHQVRNTLRKDPANGCSTSVDELVAEFRAAFTPSAPSVGNEDQSAGSRSTIQPN